MFWLPHVSSSNSLMKFLPLSILLVNYNFFVFFNYIGIDGQEDMRPICGIIAVEGKVKRARGGKVSTFNKASFLILLYFTCKMVLMVNLVFFLVCAHNLCFSFKWTYLGAQFTWVRIIQCLSNFLSINADLICYIIVFLMFAIVFITKVAMTRKKRQLGLMIWRRSNIGVQPPQQISQ